MFKVPVGRSTSGIVAAFLDHVRVIVGGGADEEMRRVTARWIIAAMQHISPCWNWSIDAFVGYAMRTYLVSLFIADNAVAFFVSCASPWPAIIGLAWMVVEKETVS